MKFCNVEQEDRPESEFLPDRQGVLWHYPPDGATPHRPDVTGPSKEPYGPYRETPPEQE